MVCVYAKTIQFENQGKLLQWKLFFSAEAFAHVDVKRNVSHEMANRAVLRGPREPKNVKHN